MPSLRNRIGRKNNSSESKIIEPSQPVEVTTHDDASVHEAEVTEDGAVLLPLHTSLEDARELIKLSQTKSDLSNEEIRTMIDNGRYPLPRKAARYLNDLNRVTRRNHWLVIASMVIELIVVGLIFTLDIDSNAVAITMATLAGLGVLILLFAVITSSRASTKFKNLVSANETEESPEEDASTES